MQTESIESHNRHAATLECVGAIQRHSSTPHTAPPTEKIGDSSVDGGQPNAEPRAGSLRIGFCSEDTLDIAPCEHVRPEAKVEFITELQYLFTAQDGPEAKFEFITELVQYLFTAHMPPPVPRSSAEA